MGFNDGKVLGRADGLLLGLYVVGRNDGDVVSPASDGASDGI